MPINISALLHELKSRLADLYGTGLKGVYLFGSYARDTPDQESDVDILIVLNRLGSYAQEINKTSALISALSLRYGVSVSRVFVPEEDWTQRRTPFLANVYKESIPA